jgi:hypothetical protein
MAPSRTGRREHASCHLPEHPRVVTALCVLEDAQGGALKGMMPPQGHASGPASMPPHRRRRPPAARRHHPSSPRPSVDTGP